MNRASYWLKGLAVLHVLVGVLAYREPLLAWFQAGFFNAVDSHVERQAAFWFMACGWTIFMLGQLVAGYEARNLPLPRSFVWSWLALALIGTLAMPVSGFPLVLLAAVLAWRKQRNLA